MKNLFIVLALGTAALISKPSPLPAQETVLLASSDHAPETTPTTSAGTTATTPVLQPVSTPSRALTARWLDLTNFSHSERYRNAVSVGGTHIFAGAQTRSLLEGKIKLDAEGRYAIGFRVSSGRYFNWAYSNFTGKSFVSRVAGPDFLSPAQRLATLQAITIDPSVLAILNNKILSSNGWEVYMRELYASATPVKQVTVEFGSLGIERGYSTEITTFDEDGYLSGERIRFHDPKHLFFDEVGYTNAYFGDIHRVNLFERGSSLKEWNYYQVFARKKLNSHLAFSTEYTRQIGIDTLRQAAVVQTGASRIADSIRVEVYERLNSHTFAGIATSAIGPIPPVTVDGNAGFAVAAHKKVGRLSGDVGFAIVDSGYSVYAGDRLIHAVGFSLNGDTYGLGNRPFVHASLKLAPGVSAVGFYTHEVGSTHVLTLNQQGMNAGILFDFKALVIHERNVF